MKEKTLHAHKCSHLQKGKLRKNEAACQKTVIKDAVRELTFPGRMGLCPMLEALSQHVSRIHSEGGADGSSWLNGQARAVLAATAHSSKT